MRSLFTLAALAAVTPSFMLAGDSGGPSSGGALDTLGLPPWQCHKRVWAAKVAAVSTKEGIPSLILDLEGDQTNVAVGQAWIDKNKPEIGGYFVLYADGYRSYSPAAAFREGYTPAKCGDHPGEFAYATYFASVGGKTGAGGDLLTFAELVADPAKAVFARAWNNVARAIEAKVIAASAPADLSVFDIGAENLTRMIACLEDPHSGFAILRPPLPGTSDPAVDISQETAASLRAILSAIGRPYVAPPLAPPAPFAPPVQVESGPALTREERFGSHPRGGPAEAPASALGNPVPDPHAQPSEQTGAPASTSEAKQ